MSLARVHTAASTNATSTKASAGVVLGWYFFNSAGAAKYLKFYDKASAPTVGTDTPLFTLGIPAGGGCNVEFDLAVPFATGIAYAVTGTAADSDTTAVSAADVTGFFLYR
jgi:hypothetical protein